MIDIDFGHIAQLGMSYIATNMLAYTYANMYKLQQEVSIFSKNRW